MNDKFCIFSGSTENLNTSMNLKLEDGSVVEVFISDEYAETATMKNIKDAYYKWKKKHEEPQIDQGEMAKLQELAAKLGVKIVQPGEEQPEPPKPIIQPSNIPVTQITNEIKPVTPNGKIISGKLADSKAVNVNIGGDTSQGGIAPQYEITSTTKPSENLKEGEVVELNMVKAKGGLEIPIPVRRVGKTGTTTVAIINTGGDAALQRRFKNMAQASTITSYGKNGYGVRFVRCPLCGNKPNPNCKKCNGIGEIQIDV